MTLGSFKGCAFILTAGAIALSGAFFSPGSARAAVTWGLVFSDNFNRSNGSVGNGWVGSTTAATIGSSLLSLNSGTNSPWSNSILLRPTGEVGLNQRVVVDFSAVNTGFYAALRVQAQGTEYLVDFDGANLAIRTSVAGSLGSATNVAISPIYNGAHAYTLDASATGTNPTTIVATITDINTSTVVATKTLTDSTSGLQAAGQAGIFSFGTDTVDNFNEYGSAATYTIAGPSTGTVGARSVFTVTPDGPYTGTITLSDSAAGGTFSPASLTFSSSAAAQSFAYTPGSAGTKAVGAASSPALVDPSSVSVTVSSLPTYFWSRQFSDGFTRSNGAIGNGWTGSSTSAAVVSNQAYLNSGVLTPWSNSILLRPSNEVAADQRVGLTMAAGDYDATYVALRTQSQGTEYLVGYDGVGNLAIRASVGGTLGAASNVALSPSFNAAHSYQLDARAFGSNPTYLQGTLTDLNTSSVVATQIVADSTSTLQAGGQVGAFAFGTSTIDDFASYSGSQTETAASSYTLTGPSTVPLFASSTPFLVTPDADYRGTITPSDGGAGGTFTPASLVFASTSDAQSFVYTPASVGAKTISAASNPALSNPSSLSVAVQYWLQEFSDDFNRGNGSVGNGWVGSTTSATVSSSQLGLSSGTNAPWKNGLLLRPAGEVASDQRVTLTYPGSDSSPVYAALRAQSAGTEYLVGINTPSQCTSGSTYCIQLFSSYNGSLSATFGAIPFSSFNASHSYRLDASASGASPTTIAASVTDLNSGAVVATTSLTDATSTLQSGGQVGVFAYGSAAIDDFADYVSTTTTASAYALAGPSAATLNQASSPFTVTPNSGYSGTITPSDGSAGGSFSPASLTFSGSAAPQTFTYTPGSLGAKTVSVSSSPGIADPSPISLTVTSATAGFVAVNDPNLYWSPYNWHANGSTWTETTPGGAYLKIAFTGSTLKLDVSTSTMSGVDLSGVAVDAYVDGSGTAITRTLGALSAAGVLTFSTSLGAGSHYAIIYLSKTPQVSDRWNGPAEVLRVTGIQLASDGSGNSRSLSGTPIAPLSGRLLIYGDSITEGIMVSSAEKSYAAVMAQQLGYEYGQVGYGFLGWTHQGTGNTPYFYDSTATSSSLWRYFDAGKSRMVSNADLSQGFLDGTPNAVFVNMGINDADTSTGAALMRYKVAAWLADVRTALGANPAIFVISPFNFGSTTVTADVTYKAALIGGISDYQSTHPSDQRVYALDLGTSGYNTVQSDTSDGLHPRDTASASLGQSLAALALPNVPYVPPVAPSVSSASASSIGQGSATLSASLDSDGTASSTAEGFDYGLTSSYGSSASASSAGFALGAFSQTVSGLSCGTAYHYRAFATNSAGTAVTGDQSFTTGSCPTVTTGGGGGGGGGGGSSSSSGGGGGYAAPAIATSTAACPAGFVCRPLPAVKCPTGFICTPAALATASPAYSAVPAGAAPSLTRYLYLGLSGPDVLGLQRYLNALGFTVSKAGAGSPGHETPYFGPATQAALREFQCANGVACSAASGAGILGSKTTALISSGRVRGAR